MSLNPVYVCGGGHDYAMCCDVSVGDLRDQMSVVALRWVIRPRLATVGLQNRALRMSFSQHVSYLLLRYGIVVVVVIVEMIGYARSKNARAVSIRRADDETRLETCYMSMSSLDADLRSSEEVKDERNDLKLVTKTCN